LNLSTHIRYFCRVKRLLLFLLVVLVGFTGFIPCSVFDDCSESAGKITSPANTNDKACSHCAPFCVCANNGISFQQSLTYAIVPPEESVVSLSDYIELHFIFIHPAPLIRPPQNLLF
jgi:hypothetical protein